ncbi:DUF4407 domain-containing protein [Phocaeicola salanitronis]|uniref:DUF4407 domain-containing protein n=1 Tax=Phocaeicola salanitronis TaxID=376805 RepID=UPI0023F967EE|nr:DUF4407 domain-containing protein [Phocaeicola salanitronis]
MKWWIKFGCFLTGWNSKILSQCSEASYKHLKKYTAALLILIIMWGFTGFCFAQRYVGAPLWGCIVSAFIFIIIVIQIERQIILTVGSNRWGTCFRFFIAIIMSVLGSAILDQIIFGDDIKRKMVEITDRQVQEQLPMRLNVIDARLRELQFEIDSLDKVNMKLNEEIAKQPTIKTISTSTTYKNERQEDGSYKKIPETTVSTNPMANPRIKQVEANTLNLERLRKQQDDFIQNKMNVENDLRKELSSNVGFLEELRAMIEILSTRIEALFFYLVIFGFLISLELFVVTSKVGDKKCDYDLIVEHQLNIKKAALEELVKNIS